MQKSLPLVFFGSGPVALASLKALHEVFPIEFVVTKPAKPHQKTVPLVEAWAKEHKLRLVLVSNKDELDAVLPTMQPHADTGVVVDFGIIISPMVINDFKLGIINSHFSLLPLLRGADPITFAILEGHKQTGVSLMRIVPELDEGPLLLQESVPIYDTDTVDTLTSRLIEKSNDCMIKSLPKYIAGDIDVVPQANTKPTYTRKLVKSDGVIDWTKSASVLAREVRAFYGWPGSQASIRNKSVIITEAVAVTTAMEPGEVLIDRTRLVIGCGEGSLEILKLKVAGKKEMSAEGFIAGYC